MGSLGLMGSTSPKREVRAACVVTEGGLDWPRGALTADAQQRAMRVLLSTVVDNNFNAVYVQMTAGGGGMWTGDYLPPMFELTGHAGQRPDYDPVAFIIDECRYLGLDCNATLNVLDLGSLAAASRFAASQVKHLSQTHPEYCFSYQGRWYLNPGVPGARDFIVEAFRELLSQHRFDGVLFAGLYYPAGNVDDVDAYRNFNPDYLSRDQWRRLALNTLADDLYTMVKSIDPDIRVGFSSLAAYHSIPGYQARSAYGSAYQDPVKWINDGYADYVAPEMTVTEATGFPSFIEAWNVSVAGGDVLPVLKPAMMDDGVNNWPVDALTWQVESVRSNPLLNGMAFDNVGSFSPDGTPKAGELCRQLRESYFRQPSLMPLRPGAVSQLPPANVSAEWNGSEYRLSWDQPFSADGVEPRFYSVYLAGTDGNVDVTDMDNLLLPRVTACEAVIPSTLDGLNFGVTAVNRYYSESVPALSVKAGIDDVSTLTTRFIQYGELIEVESQHTIERIDIFNINGSLMRSIKVNGNQAVIETGDLPRAFYVARCVLEGAMPSVDKFIR